MKRQPLKGLLIFSLFGSKGSLLMSFGLVLVFVIPAIVVGLTPMTGLMIMLLIPAVSFFLHNDAVKTDKTKWNKFQLSLPIRRRDVITSQYVYFLLLVVLALLITGFVLGIVYLLDTLNIHQMRWLLDEIEIEPIVETAVHTMSPGHISLILTVTGIGSAFLTCALYYPLRYTICRGKEELTSFLVMFGSIILMMPVPWLAGVLELSLMPLTLLLGVLIPTLLLVWSYFFTARVYQRLDE